MPPALDHLPHAMRRPRSGLGEEQERFVDQSTARSPMRSWPDPGRGRRRRSRVDDLRVRLRRLARWPAAPCPQPAGGAADLPATSVVQSYGGDREARGRGRASALAHAPHPGAAGMDPPRPTPSPMVLVGRHRPGQEPTGPLRARPSSRRPTALPARRDPAGSPRQPVADCHGRPVAPLDLEGARPEHIFQRVGDQAATPWQARRRRRGPMITFFEALRPTGVRASRVPQWSPFPRTADVPPWSGYRAWSGRDRRSVSPGGPRPRSSWPWSRRDLLARSPPSSVSA